MPYTDGVITGAVGLGDISSAIGLSSLDLGTLCQSTLISPFAVFKPFRNTAPAFSTSADYLAARKSANFGTNIPQFSSLADFHAGWNTAWSLNLPRGLASYGEYYRALDFQGYSGYASRDWGLNDSSSRYLFFPFGGQLIIPSVLNDTAVLSMSLEGSPGESAMDCYLYPYRFSGAALDIYDMYPGIAAIGSSSTNDYFITGSDTFENAGQYIDFRPTGRDLPDGTYTFVPIATKAALTSWTSIPSNIWPIISIGGYGVRGTKDSSATGLNIQFSVSASTNTVIEVTIQNSGPNTKLPILFCYLTSDSASMVSGVEDEILAALQNWLSTGATDGSNVTYSGNIVGRYVNLYTAFKAASGTNKTAGSDEIRPGGSVTFQVTLSGITSDYYGSYNADSFAHICYIATITSSGTSTNHAESYLI